MRPSLDEIVKNKRIEVASRKSAAAANCFDHIIPGDEKFLSALRGAGPNFICELKPKSPSAGILQASPDIEAIINSYAKYASAISVLTDEKYFGGTLSTLTRIAAHTEIPLLCKDFVIDQFQCYEARQAGAQAVLLIVKILEDDTLATLYNCIKNLGMTPVVEVQTREELSRAQNLEPSPDVILINNRDLSTFEVGFKTTFELAPLIPSSTVKISASGIATKNDVKELMPFCSTFLIGSSLMTSGNLDAKLEELCK